MHYPLEEQLLHASLLCGLKATGRPAYRLQLFFVANKEIGSKSHQSDFQRAIESGVDKSKYWMNYDERGSGEYVFTEAGYARAKKVFGEISPIYHPVTGKDYHVYIKGIYNDLLIELETKGNGKRSSTISINHKLISSAKEACKIIENASNVYLPTTGESAVRVLYNFAIDNNFELVWRGTRI
jgi:hypothetical protein